MRGRTPKIDGPKAREGARGMTLETIDPREFVKTPRGLCKWSRFAWEQSLKSLLPAQVLSHGDLLLLEQGARAWGRWKALELKVAELNKKTELGGELSKTPKGYVQLSPLRIAADRAMKQYMTIAREMGLTPIARVRTAGSAQGDLFNFAPAQPSEPDAVDYTDPYVALSEAPDRLQ